MSEATAEETATSETTEATESQTAGTDTEQQTDYAAEVEKWKALAQKHEQRAKSNAEKAKGYDELKASQMTEQEKAVEAAKAEARAEAIREAAPRLVSAEFRAALAGRRTPAEVSELIEDLDLSKYLNEAGEVDAERVAKKAELLAPVVEERKTAPGFGGGARKAESPDRAGSLGEAIRNKIANPTR